MTKVRNVSDRCAICGCTVHRAGHYAQPTVKGRSHATQHHFVAERFFGRSKNRPSTVREPIFDVCPWDVEGKTVILCYECHEELVHNPVFLPDDISRLADLVRMRGLSEKEKTESRKKIGGRIKLLQEVIATGLTQLSRERV